MSSERQFGGFRTTLLGILAAIVGLVSIWLAWPALSGRPQMAGRVDNSPPDGNLDAASEARIVAFCSDCHALPRPENFPRDAWHDEVLMGYRFYAESGRNDLDPPPIHSTVAYFASRAPERMIFPRPADAREPFRTTFTVERLPWTRSRDLAPAVAHLCWTRLRQDETPVLLVTDMRLGCVVAVDLQDPRRPQQLLAQLNNPCRIEPCDLDGDGAIDLLVADLGSFRPDDHNLGRVVWLRPRPDHAPSSKGSRNWPTYDTVVLASGLGRVADVRAGDVDNDGDLDLTVAEFGLFRTGSVTLLRNHAGRGQVPRFQPEILDHRSGAIHVPMGDLDGDGRLDIVALISQEHECLEAFFNQGGGKFYPRPLWVGPDLTFGSSGIELVDLDQDGDLDILYTNGDSFDNMYVNPSHGVQWLENLGSGRFAYHRLADLTGAYRALAGDFDQDGDLDIIAVAWLPERVKPADFDASNLPTVLCLEQTAPGVFVRHTLATGTPRCVALEIGDFDGDGDLDFAIGAMAPNSQEMPFWVEIWWNQKVPSKG